MKGRKRKEREQGKMGKTISEQSDMGFLTSSIVDSNSDLSRERERL